MLAMVVGAIVVGIEAQTMRGRTGAAWGALTYLMEVLVYSVFFFSVSIANPVSLERSSTGIALALIGVGGPAVAMRLIVLTLPDRRKKRRRLTPSVESDRAARRPPQSG